MGKNTRQGTLAAHEARKLLNQTLGDHLERLIGTRYGIEALSLNLATISCLILLTERENDIESFPSSPPDRYTRETLLNELAAINIDTDEEMNNAVHDMIQKGYIDVDNVGSFFSKKPTTSMAQLLDMAFPGMPGMNLVVYFTQIIYEAHSGRKDLRITINQFDKRLQKQGVPLNKKRTRKEQKNSPKPHADRKISFQNRGSSPTVEQQATLEQVLKRTEFHYRPPTDILNELTYISTSESKTDSPHPDVAQAEIREEEIGELPSGQDEPTVTPPEMDEDIDARKAEIFEEEKEEERETPPEILPDIASESASDEQGSHEDTASTQGAGLPIPEPIAQETALPEDLIDDAIERQIASFEEDLAMICPLCKTAKVQTEKTATGKIYYKCSNKDCNFISWGKPYHIVCEQCGNPFLVETTYRDGKTILKCPRSTCRYWLKHPSDTTDEPLEKTFSPAQTPAKSTITPRKPRRRVIRKRVVLRKR